MPIAMTALRPTVPLPLHGAAELVLGVVALLAPFALGFTLAGAILAVIVGVCAVGLALDAAEQPARVSTHRAFDYAIACAALIAAIPLALIGDAAAALFLSGVGLAETALHAVTRYSLRAT